MPPTRLAHLDHNIFLGRRAEEASDGSVIQPEYATNDSDEAYIRIQWRRGGDGLCVLEPKRVLSVFIYIGDQHACYAVMAA
jgi:hypothetical protein